MIRATNVITNVFAMLGLLAVWFGLLYGLWNLGVAYSEYRHLHDRVEAIEIDFRAFKDAERKRTLEQWGRR